MFLFRLLTMGVCVACVVKLATLEPGCLRVQPDLASYAPLVDRYASAVPHGSAGRECGERLACEDRRPPVSVLDVAHGVAPDGLAELVHLRSTEWVSAVNDRALDPDIPVGYLIASLAPHAGEFLDLTVSSATTERRVLVLLH